MKYSLSNLQNSNLATCQSAIILNLVNMLENMIEQTHVVGNIMAHALMIVCQLATLFLYHTRYKKKF